MAHVVKVTEAVTVQHYNGVKNVAEMRALDCFVFSNEQHLFGVIVSTEGLILIIFVRQLSHGNEKSVDLRTDCFDCIISEVAAMNYFLYVGVKVIQEVFRSKPDSVEVIYDCKNR